MRNKNKKVITLTESQLKEYIVECLSRHLKEADMKKAQAGVRQMKDSVRGKETNTHTNSGLYADGSKQIERYVNQILEEIVKACENAGIRDVKVSNIEGHFKKSLEILGKLVSSKPSKAEDVSNSVKELLTFLRDDITLVAKKTRHDGSHDQIDPTIRIKVRKALLEIADEVDTLLRDVDHFDPSDLNTVLRVAKSELSSFKDKAVQVAKRVGSKARDLGNRVRRGVNTLRDK